MAQQRQSAAFRPPQENYRSWPEARVPLDGGIVDGYPANAIEEGESPACLNIDFDKGSVKTSRGALKFNNQVAPSSALRFSPDKGMAKIVIAPGKSVPLRNYLELPYAVEHDRGGSFVFEGTFPTSDTYHNRRGQDFEIDFSYRLPMSERLYTQDTKGTGAPATPDANFNPFHGFDEALDECHVILGKGCDGNAPMSWAIGVVNIGKQAVGDASGITAPVSRVSNYCLVFMWFDGSQAGEIAPAAMRYTLTSGAAPSAGAFSTQAFRAIILHKFIEPGRVYKFALQLHIDTGSPGGIATNTAWNHDGYVKLWCSEDNGPVELVASFVDSGGGGTATGIDVYKGPTDSLRYLSKYGVRFAGRDSMQVGLGMRSTPWQTCGFIPYGADAAPLEFGGWRMIDRSATTVASLYGGGIYTLTGFKNANADAFLRINHGGFSNGNTNGGADPMGTHAGGAYQLWFGLGGGSLATFNPEALRGYRLVTTADFTPGTPDSRGAIFSILSYAENAGNHEVTILGGSSINAFGAVGAQFPLIVQCFRWHQRSIEVGDIRIYSTPRAYDDADPIRAARRKLSLKQLLDVNDPTELDIETLLASWRCDDSGGKVVREQVFGRWRNGQFAPFGIGQTDGGSRGKKMLYLSGEGEALTLDLSTNPVAKREIAAMMRGSSQGFALEITCVFTRAMYAIMSPTAAELLPDSAVLFGNRPRLVPDIMSWDVRDPETSGFASVPRNIIALSYRALRSDPSNIAPYQRPASFGVEVAVRSDQHDINPIVHSDLLPWFLSGGVDVSRYDTDASWVGKLVTIQIGIQSTGVADTYQVYIALHPKQNFLPGSADPGDAEFAYRTTGGGTYDFSGTYFQASTIVISRRDIERSIVTIGGGWRPRGLGARELNCPMLIDEVRIFGCAAPGSLPTTNGGVLTNRDGKLEGVKCLPPRLLTRDDILQLPGANLAAVNLTDGARTATPSGSARFFTEAASTTRDSVAGAYLAPRGDIFDQPNPERPSEERDEFYRVASVAADGSSLTTDTSLATGTRRNAGARVFRLLGYTAFEDDLGDRELPVASGPAYDPNTSTTDDAIITEPFFENLSPVGGGFGFRIYGPGVRVELPQWVRGHSAPRRLNPEDGILGIASVNETIFAAVRGALFEADDRWRPEGPDARCTRSLAFRAVPRGDETLDANFPLENDRVVFNTAQGLTFVPSVSHAYATRYDAWVQVDTFAEYQTVFWVGDLQTDPQKVAGTHKVHMISRLNRGRPEFVLGSTAVAAGAVTPEKGLWTATASVTIDQGDDAHVRWVLATRSSGGTSVLLKPYCLVNGKLVAVTVNAVENHASITQATDWLRTSTITQPGPTAVVLMGCARDSYLVPETNITLTAAGVQMRPQRIQGYLHSLGGTIAELHASTVAAFVGNPPPFDPHTLTYSDSIDTLFAALGPGAEGVGAKVRDSAAGQYGVIVSHPFISLWHQFGRSDEMVSFAHFGQQLYAVNGERMVLINNGTGAFAGVLPPESELDFSLVRLPIWEPNTRLAATPGNDPVQAAAANAAITINHLRASGNNYLKQPLTGADATAMKWEKDDYFHFKKLWRCDSITGRVPIWRKGSSKESGGPFVECRDGVLVLGWYDILLKTECAIPLSGPVFQPGELYYINVRKRWPVRDAVEGNWVNSFYSDGRIRKTTFSGGLAGTFQVGETITWAGAVGILIKTYGSLAGIEYFRVSGADPVAGQVITGSTSLATGTAAAGTIRPMHDVAIVRKFRRTAPTNAKDDALDALVSSDLLGDNWSRNMISFTTATVANCTATGAVTPPGCTFTGGAGGQVNTGNTPAPGATAWGGAGAGARLFHPDMCGMYFQWASGAFVGQVFRIITISAGNQMVVRGLDGSTPDFTGILNTAGGVFIGIGLVPSSTFNASSMPDTGAYDIEFMGSALAGDLLSGIAPHVGRAWSPGWGITAGAGGDDARCFEDLDTTTDPAGLLRLGNDPMSIGTDKFPVQNYDGAGGDVGPLRFDNGMQFFCTDGQTYTSVGWTSNVTTQPNSTLTVAKDPHAPNTAPTATGSSPADPVWQYIQAPATWAAKRFFAVAFFDPDQNLLSNPGPVLSVQPAGEDASNPSGTVQALLKRLPIAPPGVNAELWILESTANGSAAGLFRVLRVPNLTAETSVDQLEARISQGVAIPTDNGEPPECRIIANSNGRVFAAALTALEQLDGVIASKNQSPAQFVYAKTERINTGAGDAVTGLAELDGLLLAMKRKGVFSITLNASDTIIAEIITSGTGCVAHQSLVTMDGRAIWRSDRGIDHAARGKSATDLAAVAWLSEKLHAPFLDGADNAAAHRSSATTVPLRHQYLVTLKMENTPYSSERVSAMGDVFSRYRHPNVTALASVRDRAGGVERLVGGTQEGFLVWMDREDAALLMLGSDEDASGSSTILIAGSGSTATAILVGAGAIDTDLDGMRGALVRFRVGDTLYTPEVGDPFYSGGVEYEAVVLSTEGGVLHLDRPITVLPVGNATATIGAIAHEWRSKMSDLGRFEKAKQVKRLDVEFAEGSSGRFRVEFYTDNNQTDVQDICGNLDVDARVVSVPVAIKAKHVQARILSEPLTAGGAWEVTSIVWRIEETDQT